MAVNDLFKEFLAAGIGCAIADSLFNPLEIIKVKLQVEVVNNRNNAVSSVMSIKRVYQHVVYTLKNEGILQLWLPGLVPTVVRGFFYAGFRIGFYPRTKQFINDMYTILPSNTIISKTSINSTKNAVNQSNNSSCNDIKVDEKKYKDIDFSTKFLAGATVGFFGSFIFSPLDLIRIRFQKDPNAYPNIIYAFINIYKFSGIKGFWVGARATVVRATLLSSCQLSLYDQIKTMSINNYNDYVVDKSYDSSNNKSNHSSNNNSNKNNNNNNSENHDALNNSFTEKSDSKSNNDNHNNNKTTVNIPTNIPTNSPNKQQLTEGPAVHAFASLISGIIAQIIIMPIDNIKTHMMILNDTTSSNNSNNSARNNNFYNVNNTNNNVSNNFPSDAHYYDSKHSFNSNNNSNDMSNTNNTSNNSNNVTNKPTSSVIKVFKSIVRERGFVGLYRGMLPAVMRQGPCILLQMPLIEQIRILFGLDYM